MWTNVKVISYITYNVIILHLFHHLFLVYSKPYQTLLGFGTHNVHTPYIYTSGVQYVNH